MPTASEARLRAERNALRDETVPAAERRATRAEKALADFKTQVRDAVIREAEDRGWCDEVDDWLEELGLESRHAGLPTAPFAFLRLNDGRVVLLCDSDDTPWKDGHGNWLSFDEVKKIGVADTVYDGDTYSGEEYSNYSF